MPVQRWRLTFSRGSEAPDLNQREQIAAWHGRLEDAGLRDAAYPEPSRFVLAAPVPTGLTADRELADLFLPERRTAADVRARLDGNMPEGHRLADVHDVWLGEPALPGLVVAADYQVDVEPGAQWSEAARELSTAAAAFLTATTIDRRRTRPDRPASGNLRPLVIDLRPLAGASIWMRLRFDPSIGTGRPEEVVEALGVLAGRPLVTTRRHRERLWLRGEDMTEPRPLG